MPDLEPAISQADRQKILASAADYMESWLDGDAERMARCLHPELAKRAVKPDPETGGNIIDTTTRDEMIAATREGYGTRLARPYEIAILDGFGDIATVRVLSAPYMDYLHVARFGDEWLLLNVLWQPRPKP